jgi:hypothetical protein
MWYEWEKIVAAALILGIFFFLIWLIQYLLLKSEK